MTFVRPARRVLIAAASMSALFVAAACGGGGGAPSGGGSSRPPELISPSKVTSRSGTARTPPGTSPKQIEQFNDSHPNGKVIVHELPDSADQQRQQMVQNTQIKNPKMAVLSVDVVWTAEFAAKQYVEALPPDQFPTEGFLKATVDSATYFNKLYAYPSTSDGGLLYYRKDLLDKYGLKPPTSFDEMKAACDKITGRRERLQARLLRRPVQQVRGSDGELRRGRARCGRCHRW